MGMGRPWGGDESSCFSSNVGSTRGNYTSGGTGNYARTGSIPTAPTVLRQALAALAPGLHACCAECIAKPHS